VVEKTKMMKLTDEQVTSSAASQERRRGPLADAAVNSSVDVGAAVASVETREDAARRHQIHHEEAADSDSKVPVTLVAQIRSRKKLLVLDLNGLLADINRDSHNAHLSHGRCRGKLGKVALGCFGIHLFLFSRTNSSFLS
jgi:hypothetical protein